ncbi:MAG: nuclease, partial [Candidatus Limnocylindrales bacterium]
MRMQLIDGNPVFSATDLVGFLECEHLTNLDRAALAGLVARPIRDDPEIDLIAKRGDLHEKRYLGDLEAAGKQVTRIEKDGYGEDRSASLREAAAETLVALRRGDEVIYQATFFDGRWRGHADFLTRVPVPSDLGTWSYEVADTKLARSTKAGALLQMCVYSDLLTAVQGVQPEWMEVALGGSARKVERFRVDDYMAYYRRVKGRFEALVLDGEAPAFPPADTYPEPVEHC